MSKKANTARPPRSPAIGGYLAVAAISALLGATICWLTLRDGDEPVQQSMHVLVPQPPSTTGLPPAQAEVVLGNWNYDRRNWPHAIEHYEKAVALGLDNADVRTDLGNCFRFAGQPQKALEHYETAQRQNPRHENSLFNAATLYAESLGDPARAAELLREFLARFPSGPAAENARRFLAQMNTSPTANERQIVDSLTRDNPAGEPKR